MCQVPFITPKKECISCEHQHYYGGKYPWNCYNFANKGTRCIRVSRSVVRASTDSGKGTPKFPVLEGLKPCPLLAKNNHS